jgi:hypothetical protein
MTVPKWHVDDSKPWLKNGMLMIVNLGLKNTKMESQNIQSSP